MLLPRVDGLISDEGGDEMMRIGDLGRLTPQTVRGYRELSDAGNKTAHLDAKTRELIAIAVGVTRPVRRTRRERPRAPENPQDGGR